MTAGPEAQPTAPAQPETQLRADARRKRDRIVAAAKERFARQGPDAPMEEIAREAGVGVGTLYRRFPDRQALIRAVAQDNFAAVLAETQAAAREEPTAWAAFVRVVRHSRELRLSVRLAISSPLARSAIRDDPLTAQFRRDLLGTLSSVVRGAQAEGALRPDVSTADVTMLLSLLLSKSPASPQESAWLSERAPLLMLDALSAQPGRELPGPSPVLED